MTNVTSRHLHSRIVLEERKYKLWFYESIRKYNWHLESSDLAGVESVTWNEFKERRGRMLAKTIMTKKDKS
jgi:hypothetical protein